MTVVSETSGDAKVAPLADAGLAQTVVQGAVVTLDASGSTDANRDPLTYAWTLVSKPTGSTASLSSASAQRPSFTADVTGSFVFSLVVRDAQLTSQAAVVVVTVVPPNVPPVAVARMTTPEPVSAGTQVNFTAVDSSDAEGQPLSYRWRLTTVPTGSTAGLTGALVWWLGPRFGGTGGLLPGDLSLRRGNMSFHFPIVTCVVVSIVLTLLLRLFQR